MNDLPPDLVARLAKDDTLPDIRDLLSHIHQFFGGTAAYAAMLVEDVKAAPQGSNPRLSFHNNFLTAIAKYAGGDPLDGLGREELAALAQNLLREGGDNAADD